MQTPPQTAGPFLIIIYIIMTNFGIFGRLLEPVRLALYAVPIGIGACVKTCYFPRKFLVFAHDRTKLIIKSKNFNRGSIFEDLGARGFHGRIGRGRVVDYTTTGK